MSITKKKLVNHPGMWLNSDAADALERFEAVHGRLRITSAGRTKAEQQALMDRWNAGGQWNRPPYLYLPATPGTSLHEVGNAIDTSDFTRLVSAPDFGFYRSHPNSDPVHFAYDEARDKNKPQPKPAPVKIHSDLTGLPVKGIQKMLKRFYGYVGAIDNLFGRGSIMALQLFLSMNGYAPGKIDGRWGPDTARATQRWLKARWGYKGAIDAKFLTQSKAAWRRANTANDKAF